MESIIIPITDYISCFIHKCFYPRQKIHHNTRWFLIHAVINSLVTYYNFWDTYLCLTDPVKWCLTPMSQESFFATNIAFTAHIYHMIIFYKYLKPEEWFHHLVMLSINGLSVYILGIKSQSASTFFLCGLPGMIDYYLLWSVKMGLVDKKIQKDIYLYLTSFIRSPGATIISYSSLLALNEVENYWLKLYYLLLISINFWNGQYYMMVYCKDYGIYTYRT